jgi:hypothetical protein
MSNETPGPQRNWWANFKSFYFRQIVSLVWMLAAIGLGLLLRGQITWLADHVDYSLTILLSGFFGLMIPNLAQFGRAGRIITRGENARLNLLAAVAMVVILVLLFHSLVLNLVQ